VIFFSSESDGGFPVDVFTFNVTEINTPERFTAEGLVQLVPACPDGAMVNVWSDNGLCKECPQGAVCSSSGLSMPVAAEGFWQLSSAEQIYQPCYPTESCVGGAFASQAWSDDGLSSGTVNIPNVCGEGYEGRMCMTCSPGYFRVDAVCMVCPTRAEKLRYRLAFFVSLAVMALLGLKMYIDGIEVSLFTIGLLSFVQVWPCT
jgi:hypothetical protein